jgi:hypothetical protein
MGQDMLANAIAERDAASGKSQLPWLNRIFAEQGAVYENFYTRGISLSAPSWSMLDTGHHTVIRGNVEYDRFTGEVYDYLNFFPLYIGYAREKQVDMPGVEVLDRAGIPLLSDRFQFSEVFQSFQLFQRGVHWETFPAILKRKFSSKAIFSMLEGATPSYDSLLEQETQTELEDGLKTPRVVYLDLFTGDVDHEGHASNEPAALLNKLRELDKLTGQIWTAIQKSSLAERTLLVMVSDHGMNNVPGILSQTYNLSDLLNSPAGGAHHVVTDREQLSDFKFKSLNPLLHRVVTPSESSFYLNGEAEHYPTAWLDIDGNERAALQLRNSDINKVHILLKQLARTELDGALRKAAAQSLNETLNRHRAQWSETARELEEELAALKEMIAARKVLISQQPGKPKDIGELRASWRLRQELDEWEGEAESYGAYLARLERLSAFEADSLSVLKRKISDLIPEMSLGDSNSKEQLRHYVAGPAQAGLQLKADGKLDEERSFRYVDYPRLLSKQHALNRPQAEVPDNPIDFVAMRSGPGVYWLYANEESQIEIFTDPAGRIRVKPVGGEWRAGLPLALFEDRDLELPPGARRRDWLSEWHTEEEWFAAIHRTRYSNGVIGVIEEMSPVGANVPGRAGLDPILLRYERRRRELVQADLHIFAADHWNFNSRFPNPGGNHGSFLRISTHSVWMMAGGGVKPSHIEEPVDSLAFARVVLGLMQAPEHH